MSVLKGRRVGGKAWKITPAPPGAPPGQVGGLSPGTPAATTIPLSYAPASGTAPITYAGSTSPHGAAAWTPNAATFTETGGTFTGLAAGTTYDLRIVATNAYGSSTTDYLAGVSTASAGTAPSKIGSFTPGPPSANTIPISFTPAGGTAPITYAGYVSPHGANAWTFDASLSSTGGLFTGLTPSTIYDLRVVASNAYGTSTTDYLAGVTTAPAPPNTLSATRYDIVPDRSSGPVGATGTVTISPNAAWAGNGTATITLGGSGVSFPNGPSAVIPSSGTAPLTVAYAITGTGELQIVGSNSGALANPYPAPFNAFASASGTAQTLAASIMSGPGGASLDLQPFQRDTASGNPNGWGTTFGKGWGEVWVSITPGGASAGLWAKLVDADSGTYLQSSPVQVYGAVSGAATVRLILPASNKRCLLELATDAAWTNPVRLAQRFMVGIVLGCVGPSQQCGFLRAYAYVNHEGTGNSYTRTVTMLNSVAYYTVVDYGTPYWFPHANQTTGPDQMYGEYSSAAAQEWGRLIESQFGVLAANVGTSHLGQGADVFVAQDGTIAGGTQTAWGFVNNKFRYCLFNLANGASAGYDFAAATSNNIAYMAAHYPACAVLGYNFGGTGIFGIDGSRPGGYTRLGQIALGLAAGNPRIVSLDDYHWNDYKDGHSTMAARTQYARAVFEAFLDAELLSFGGRQTSNRGPLLATTGTMSSTGRVIRLPYKHHGGGALSAKAVNCSGTTWTYTSDVTAAELGFLFAVYAAGGYSGNGQAIQISGAAINTVNPPAGYDGTLDLTLSGSTGVTYADNSTGGLPAGFSVHFAADFGVSGAGGLSFACGRCPVLVDDQVDTGNGLGLGRHIRPLVDIAVSVA